MASGRIAPSVFSVSTSDSPLLTLDPDAVIDTASAPRRLAAISKLVRVRVEASKNRLTIILPRSVSSFFKLWLCIGWKSLARARMASIWARSSSSIPSNPAGMARLPGPLTHQDLFHAIDLLELDFNDLDIAGLHLAPDEARLDRQFAVSAVDQHQQLHPGRAAVVEQRVQRGADGAAGVQHVVHQDDILTRHGKRNLRRAHHRLDVHRAQIVAIQVDVEDAHRDFPVFQALDLRRKPLRQRNAAAPDANKGELIQIFRLLQDLVSQPYQGPVDLRGAHELCFFARDGHKGELIQIFRLL